MWSKIRRRDGYQGNKLCDYEACMGYCGSFDLRPEDAAMLLQKAAGQVLTHRHCRQLRSTFPKHPQGVPPQLLLLSHL